MCPSRQGATPPTPSARKSHSFQIPRPEAHCGSHCNPAPDRKIGLSDYLWQIRKTDSPLYDCGDRQTLRHALLDCSKHRVLQKEVWGVAGSGWKGPRPPTSLRLIWESQRAKAAAIFLLRTGLLGCFTRSAVEDEHSSSLSPTAPNTTCPLERRLHTTSDHLRGSYPTTTLYRHLDLNRRPRPLLFCLTLTLIFCP